VANAVTVVFTACGFVKVIDFHGFAVSLTPSDEVGAPAARSLAALDKTWRLIAGPCGQVWSRRSAWQTGRGANLQKGSSAASAVRNSMWNVLLSSLLIDATRVIALPLRGPCGF
jgi:hypothetical protein